MTAGSENKVLRCDYLATIHVPLHPFALQFPTINRIGDFSVGSLHLDFLNVTTSFVFSFMKVYFYDERSEVLTALVTKSSSFRDMMPCSLETPH